jgi:hypothetical protein
MSLFNWFGKNKAEPPPTAPRSSSGLAQLDATLPNVPPARPVAVAAGGSRKQERHAMRELLYTVVRESMNKMGVLSSSFKFKVLSLDSRGRQYLVMMDVQRLQTGEVGRMAEIETLIAQTAKARHDILVTAVYWRLSDPSGVHASAAARGATAVGAAAPASAPAPVPQSAKPAFEPIHADEVDAFKKALAGVPRAAPLSKPGELVHSGPMLPSSDTGFADTEVDDRATPLSATQYGDL